MPKEAWSPESLPQQYRGINSAGSLNVTTIGNSDLPSLLHPEATFEGSAHAQVQCLDVAISRNGWFCWITSEV